MRGVNVSSGNALRSEKIWGLFFIALLFFAPNLATLLSGFHGFYATYFSLGLLVSISLPLVLKRRGLGFLDTATSLSLALLVVSVYTALGFLWGFASTPRLTPSSLLVNLAVFLVQVLSVEVARSLVMGLFKDKRVAVATGVLVGLLFGKTVLAIVDYLANSLSTPLPLLRDTLYSTTVTLLHLNGGFVPALLFRLILDGYWKFSPLVLNTSEMGVLWSAVSSLVYYSTIAYQLYGFTKLRGSSKRVYVRSPRVREVLYNGVVLALCVLLLVSAYFRVVPMVVVSGSMRPTLEVGDIVLVNTNKPLNISLGDIVAFRFEGMVITHRVVEVLDGGFRTKGDGNQELDPFVVSEDMVVGEVIASIPRVGLLAILVQQGINALSENTSLPVILVFSAVTLVFTALFLRGKWIAKSRTRVWK